jgi:tetratricopeptide (TPR) repeat protein
LHRSIGALALLALTALSGESSANSLLPAAALASPRPAECLPTAPRGGAERLWDRARTPGLAAYCNALARGYARLRRTPEAALEAAQVAQRALPNRAAPRVLEARALVALGRHADAWQRFSAIDARARRELEVPAALHDYAVAASVTGHGAEALRAYRALVPRAGLLDEARRTRALIEASVVTMASGASALDEAIGYLNEARRRNPQPGLEPLVLAALALALDRQGHPQQARGLIAEVTAPEALFSSAKGAANDAMPVLPALEQSALIAMLLERFSPEEAKERWTAVAAGGSWSEHAKKKLVQLDGPRARSK